MSLKGKKIIIGISGGIAAYKIPLLVRLFKKQGAEVRVMMTDSALDFVTPLSLSTLSGNPVIKDFVKDSNGQWNNHVEWGLWADLILIAPATANTLSKMAHGQAGNFLTAVYLSAKCPVFIAPAMDLDMYLHPATQKNLEILKNFGNRIIPATVGELASGLIGPGRMEEPENIYKIIDDFFNKKPLKGKKVLVTAGPTYEDIDPVRFIGNHSSGKMGIAIADQAAEMGADVELILGPSKEMPSHPDIKITNVRSAKEMFEAAMKVFPSADISIMSAAVADFTPKEKAVNKIKKDGNTLQLELKKTRDILKKMGEEKKPEQILVGFAMETENEKENAKKKLEKKNLDFIVLNSLNDKNAGFQSDTNKVSIFHRNGKQKNYPLKTKKEVAKDILNEIINNYV